MKPVIAQFDGRCDECGEPIEGETDRIVRHLDTDRWVHEDCAPVDDDDDDPSWWS